MKTMFSEWGLFLIYVIVGAFAFYIFSKYTMTYQSSTGVKNGNYVYVTVLEGMIAKISGTNVEEVNKAKGFVQAKIDSGDDGWKIDWYK